MRRPVCQLQAGRARGRLDGVPQRCREKRYSDCAAGRILEHAKRHGEAVEAFVADIGITLCGAGHAPINLIPNTSSRDPLLPSSRSILWQVGEVCNLERL